MIRFSPQQHKTIRLLSLFPSLYLSVSSGYMEKRYNGTIRHFSFRKKMDDVQKI